MSRAFSLVIAFCLAESAHAQGPSARSAPSAQDEATADVLFKKGVAELEAGNLTEACATIEASQKLVPRPGTLFTLAECYSQATKPASAIAMYDEFLHMVRALPSAQQKRYVDRIAIATDAKLSLARSVSLLSIVLPKNAPSNVKVLRDGVEVATSLLGVPIPVDPGEHSLAVEIPGRPRSEQKVKLELRERRTVELRLPDAPPPPTASPVEAPKTRVALAYAAFGVGAAGMLVGGITGAIAWSHARTADAECKAYVCNAKGAEAVLDGRAVATWSTVGFAVGGAGLAAGVWLWLSASKTEPQKVRADLMFDASSVFLRAQGRF